MINIQRAITKSFATKTLQNYSSAIHTFLAWCDTHNIHDDLCFPASEYALCAYIEPLSASRSKSSINGSLAALKAWYNACGRTWNDSPRISMVARGAAASAPAPSLRPARKPVTTDMLTAPVRGLNLRDPTDAAIAAAALVAFWRQCRLGELVGTAKLKHDSAKHPSCSSLGPPVSLDGSRELSLPSTKTRHASGETVVLTAQHGSICPVTAINYLLSLTSNIRTSAHIFAHPARGRADTTHSLAKETFLKRVNDIWRSTVSGHAFRIGRTSKRCKQRLVKGPTHSNRLESPNESGTQIKSYKADVQSSGAKLEKLNVKLKEVESVKRALLDQMRIYQEQYDVLHPTVEIVNI
ncbi:hypothetical protein FRC10_007231 [Ceratobasidium sp. 414]|nr:hypothetical protein FRC10_007231 [Ceratobasidium sp. 414]